MPKGKRKGRVGLDQCPCAGRHLEKFVQPAVLSLLTSNNMMHPHVVNSDMYKEADWLMNEAGDMKRISAIKSMVGMDTRLITCLAGWNGQDATKVVPEAEKAGIGLYGFAKPGASSLLPLETLLACPVPGTLAPERQIFSDVLNSAVLQVATRLGLSQESVQDALSRAASANDCHDWLALGARSLGQTESYLWETLCQVWAEHCADKNAVSAIAEEVRKHLK